MKYIARIILLMILGLIVMAILDSCNTQKRCERFLKKHPECIKIDTFVFMDTFTKEIKVPVPEYKDSFIIKTDTFIETKKLLVTKYKDKFTIKVKPDTIIYRDTTRIELKVPGRVVEKKEWNWPIIFLAFTMGVLTTVFISRK
jgi:uncharacterized protein YneF (UPF0154 family)